MKNRKSMKIITILTLTLVMGFAFTACGGGDDASDKQTDETKAVQEENKATDPTVGTDAEGRKIDDQSFYGTWIADSARAENMFDGFQITFNEDGTYDAIVTEENISGTWTRDGERVTLSDTDDILPCDYTYTAKGGLKMNYEGMNVGFHR